MNYLTEYGKYLKIKRETGQEAQCLCPFHDDKVASFSFNKDTGEWYCFACGEGGSFKTFLSKLGVTKNDTKEQKHIIPEDKINEMHEKLLKHDKALNYLQQKRGISMEIIKRYKLGFDGSRIWIPIKDEYNDYVNVRKYRPKTEHGKVIGYASGYNECRIFPAEATVEDDVYIMEGEMDTLLARSLGLPSYTQTAGALTWNSKFNWFFKDKNVYIVYDNDEQGRSGAKVVSQALANVASSVHIVNLPVLKDKEDFTDYIVSYNKTKDDFIKLCKDTSPVPQENKMLDEKIHEVDLFKASSSKYYEKLVKLRVMVVGKDKDSYIVPYKVALTCSAPFKKCKFCPIFLSGGRYEVTFDKEKPEILELIDCGSDKSKRLAIKHMGGGCNNCSLEVLETINIEVLVVINDVDCITDKSDYVTLTVYYIGHGISTNANYELIGRVYPEPKTQHATVIVYEAFPAKSSIEMFELTDEIINGLKTFMV